MRRSAGKLTGKNTERKSAGVFEQDEPAKRALVVEHKHRNTECVGLALDTLAQCNHR